MDTLDYGGGGVIIVMAYDANDVNVLGSSCNLVMTFIVLYS